MNWNLNTTKAESSPEHQVRIKEYQFRITLILGKIKIIIGSEAIQEGMNLQENTTDIYMLTLPYNFTSLRQVEGRARRQGNKYENVRINFMLTNDSIEVLNCMNSTHSDFY